MEPTKNDKKSEVEGLLNKLRKKGVTAILTMNKKAQITVSNWALDLVNQYNAILKNNPMKLKNIAELPDSKMNVKLAIKLLLLASGEKGFQGNTVLDLRDKFISLGEFQSIEQEDSIKLMKYIRDIQKKSMVPDTCLLYTSPSPRD